MDAILVFLEVTAYLGLPMAVFVAIDYWCLFRDRDDG